MTSPNQPKFRPVRFSRVLPLSRLVAIGASVAAGIGVFTLIGPVLSLTVGTTVLVPFVLLLLIALPFVLTLSERAAVVAGGDAYGLTRRFGFLWLIFVNGWTQFGGYAALLALLSWGVAIHLQLFVKSGFDVDIPLNWLALFVLLGTALANVLGTHANWRRRVVLIYAALAFFAVLIVGLALTLRIGDLQLQLRGGNQNIYRAAVILVSSLWGLYVMLSVRDEARRPTHTLPRALGIVTLLVAGLGLLAAPVLTGSAVWALSMTPLLSIAENVARFDSSLLTALYVVLGGGLTLLGLSRAYLSALKLLNDMGQDDLLPGRLYGSVERRTVPTRLILLLALISAAMLLLLPVLAIAGLAATAFCYTAVCVLAPDVIRSQPLLPENRRFKLPFHPLFPALGVVLGVLLPLTLEPEILLFVLGWVLVGAVYYGAYGRARAIARRRQELVVEETNAAVESEAVYRVLVGIAHKERADMLVRTGVWIARAHGGEVVVMRILLLADQMPIYLKHERAEAELDELSALIGELGVEDVAVRPIVRIASSPLEGILGAANEEQADLLLLGWVPGSAVDQRAADPLLNSIIIQAPCEVAIVAGTIPELVERILVPTSGGPNAPVAVALARALRNPNSTQRINVVSVIQGQATPDQAERARTLQSEVLDGEGAGDDVHGRVVAVDNVQSHLLAEAREHDLVVIGVAREGPVSRSFFGGLPVRVASETDRPVLLVRAREQQSTAWLERLWALVSDPLPTLTETQREQVEDNMRSSAVPTVDFYVLILLSSMIASLGLLQNSAAVIIGAMLVAPLMSPILSMAMAIVLGEIPMLWQGAEATVKGIALAILVGLVMVMISPIDSPTSEILARTQPNILDLMVALASGAAAGYALSRKEVAAALPGVAIAAALVPPLCVVGYGLGTAQLAYATGALVLFVTNLLAIVLSAALVFLALGFEPRHDREEELVRGLRVTAVLLSIVAAVLIFATITTVQQLNRQVNVERVFRNAMVQRAATVDEVIVLAQGDTFLIQALVLAYENRDLTPDELRQLERDLEEAAGGPVVIEATVIDATRSDLADAPLIRELTTMFEDAAAEADIAVLNSIVRRTGGVFVVEATLVVSEEGAPLERTLSELQQEMSATADAPVTFKFTTMRGVFFEATAVPAPERESAEP